MELIQEQLRQAIKRVFDVSDVLVEVVPAPEDTGADYASNVAMRLAKVVHKAPMEIAAQLKEEFQGDFRVEVAAPGFLNFISPDEYYNEKIAEIAQNPEILDNFISWDEYSGKTVVAEFSDPNPFKVLHVGHLYTSVVGDSIARLLECAGAKVVRANFGGDVGLHVAKTIYCLLMSNGVPALSIEKIAECYVEGTRAYDENEGAKAEITKLNKVIYALADLGEERSQERLAIEKLAEDFGYATAEMAQIAELYWRGRALSYEYFADFYAKIGVKFDKFYPESTVAGRGLTEVKAHIGTTYEESDGAVVYRGEKVGLHTRVFINREGVPTYEAKDVGLIFTKWDDWRFDESVVITGNEQGDYMKVVLASVGEYAPELTERTRHLTHGLVKLKGGVKMSSRKGNFLKAVDVIRLVEATLSDSSSSTDALLARRMLNTARSATPVSLNSLDTEASNNLSKVALAALKYAFLKYRMGGDIVFDPKESVSTTGNSGVYLLYSAVRAKKILQKTVGGNASPVRDAGAPSSSKDSLWRSPDRVSVSQEDGATPSKFIRILNKKIVQYDEIIRGAVVEKAPHKVCGYLYELAQEFSRFYEHVPVAGSAEETERKQIVQAYLNVMTHGLSLLGIEVPEEM